MQKCVLCCSEALLNALARIHARLTDSLLRLVERVATPEGAEPDLARDDVAQLAHLARVGDHRLMVLIAEDPGDELAKLVGSFGRDRLLIDVHARPEWCSDVVPELGVA